MPETPLGGALSLWSGFALHLPQTKMLEDLFDDIVVFNKGDRSHRPLASPISRGRALGK